MKKIKSYTSIWSVEKVIYAINDFQLPFPLTFSQMAWFVVSLFVVILFGELPPFNMIDGAFLKYFGIPVAFTWFVSQKTFDGKKPFGFLKSCVSFFLRPKVTYAGKAIKLKNQKFNTSVSLSPRTVTEKSMPYRLPQRTACVQYRSVPKRESQAD